MFFGIPIPTIIVGMASLGALITVAAIAIPFLSGMEQANRFKLVTRTRANLARTQIDGLAQKGSAIRQRQSQGRVELMKKILSSLKLDEALSSKNLKASLAQAGYRNQNALVIYIFARVVLAIGLPALSAFVLFVLWKDFPHPTSTKAIIVAASFAVGYYLPSIIIKNGAQKRQKDLNSGFADALDLMVICVEGGLSVEGAFDRVTDEISDKSPTLAQEFGITSAELAYLGDRHKAYINFSDRTGLPSVKSLS
ncbi:MAG: type II secretion system F family protein, partial [Rhodospirillaceae bacterium]|nr:type II secretion system F family protein [Rhodospirillaceae bacterium]